MHPQNTQTKRFGLFIGLIGIWCLGGCSLGTGSRHPEFHSVASAVNEAVKRENCHLQTLPPATPEFEGEYSLDEYIAAALAQHPKVKAARWAVDAAAWQVPVAASLDDPKLSVTALPAPIETAAGRQNVIVGLSQKAPIRQKQVRKEAIACAEAQEAKARLAVAERDVIAQVRLAYADLLFHQEALEILKAERELLQEVTDIVTALYKANKVQQQDIAQAELAELGVQEETIAAEQALKSAQAAMARLLHVAPDTLLTARREVGLELPSDDVQQLLDRAIKCRPELHALIAKANQDRMAACLARWDYIPDPTIGASWVGIDNSGISPVANGEDAVLLNLSVNLPVYYKRIEAKIKSAESRAIGSAREYDDLRDETLRVVYDEYIELQSKLELIELIREETIPKANETLEVAIKAYGVSKTDIQQVLATWRKLIRLETSLQALQRDYRKSLATLERAVGTNVATTHEGDMSRLPSIATEEETPRVEVVPAPTEQNQPATADSHEENSAEPLKALDSPDELENSNDEQPTGFFRRSR